MAIFHNFLSVDGWQPSSAGAALPKGMVGRRMRFSLDASEANCGALYPIIIFEGKEFRLLSFMMWYNSYSNSR